MGKRDQEVVAKSGLDVKALVTVLNKAFADEWLAYYQYWLGAQVLEGPAIKDIQAELLEHAQEEFVHAQRLSRRIIELGGTPLLEPQEWYTHTNCGYKKPTNTDAQSIVQQNIDGERCAINVYLHLMNMTQGKDPITYQLALEIMSDEVKHESDLEVLARHV